MKADEIVHILKDMKTELKGEKFWRLLTDFDVYIQFGQAPPARLLNDAYHVLYVIHWTNGERLQLGEKAMALLFAVCAAVWKQSSQDEQLLAIARVRESQPANISMY